MDDSVERTPLEQAFFRLGYLLEQLEDAVPGKAGAAADEDLDEDWADEDLDVDRADHDDAEDAPFDEPADALVAAAGAWLATKLLRPHAVSWPRVVLAGVAGAALHELVRAAEDGRRPDLEPHAIAERLASGVATAAAYAALVYPRVPGPPLLRGAAFGALEAATAEAGGSVAWLRQLAPGVRVPLSNLIVPTGRPAPTAAHLAFGLALGLVYRGGDADEDEER